LGNTRVSFREGVGGAELKAKTDFDPWGVRLNGTGVVNGFQNRWELQGKEKESTFNLNRVNFGARHYNATLGRFLSSDALSEKYYGHSPYNFSLNNPIRFIDPDGNSPLDIVIRGTDEKEWRVKTAGEDIVFNAPFALKNNASLDIGAGNIDPGRFAVGFTAEGSVSFGAGLVGGVGVELSTVQFTDKTYGGYNYVYAGMQGNMSLGIQAAVSADVAGGVTIAYNNSDLPIKPIDYAGPSISVGVSAGAKFLAGGGVSAKYFDMRGSAKTGWQGVSMSVSTGVGVGGNLGSVTGSISNTSMVNVMQPTSQRSLSDRVFNRVNPVGSAIYTGAMSRVKR
jgi:RHS repeat-associated protein